MSCSGWRSPGLLTPWNLTNGGMMKVCSRRRAWFSNVITYRQYSFLCCFFSPKSTANSYLCITNNTCYLSLRPTGQFWNTAPHEWVETNQKWLACFANVVSGNRGNVTMLSFLPMLYCRKALPFYSVIYFKYAPLCTVFSDHLFQESLDTFVWCILSMTKHMEQNSSRDGTGFSNHPEKLDIL